MAVADCYGVTMRTNPAQQNPAHARHQASALTTVSPSTTTADLGGDNLSGGDWLPCRPCEDGARSLSGVLEDDDKSLCSAGEDDDDVDVSLCCRPRSDVVKNLAVPGMKKPDENDDLGSSSVSSASREYMEPHSGTFIGGQQRRG